MVQIRKIYLAQFPLGVCFSVTQQINIHGGLLIFTCHWLLHPCPVSILIR